MDLHCLSSTISIIVKDDTLRVLCPTPSLVCYYFSGSDFSIIFPRKKEEIIVFLRLHIQFFFFNTLLCKFLFLHISEGNKKPISNELLTIK